MGIKSLKYHCTFKLKILPKKVQLYHFWWHWFVANKAPELDNTQPELLKQIACWHHIYSHWPFWTDKTLLPQLKIIITLLPKNLTELKNWKRITLQSKIYKIIAYIIIAGCIAHRLLSNFSWMMNSAHLNKSWVGK